MQAGAAGPGCGHGTEGQAVKTIGELSREKIRTQANETSLDTACEQARSSLPLVETGMTRATLIENYNAIIRQAAIYYPVAYQFVRPFGHGRQGVVFLGIRQGARGCLTRHAIKLFDPAIYPSTEKYWTDMGRIAMQTSRMQVVRSPNLVARDVYEEANGIGYLQMEPVDGVDLRLLLDGSHLKTVRARCTAAEWARFTDVIFREESGRVCVQPGVAVYILRMILRGLEALHDTRFVHGDVKPGNLMVDRLGYVKLVDFGRAVMAQERYGFLLGTPLYMAPEVHRREPADIHSDLYSAGLVGIEMLRGVPLADPDRTSEEELLRLKLDLANRLPELLPPYVQRNATFVRALRRLIEPVPAARFVNAVDAESGPEGLLLVHKQLAITGQDTEYGRELENYLCKLIPDENGALW